MPNDKIIALDATLTDAQGTRWRFHYAGGSSIKTKPSGAPEGHWSNSIDLGYYGMTPEDVTGEWFQERADAWITDYNADVAAGNITH